MCLTLQSWLEYCVEVFYPSLQQHVLELIETGLQGYNCPVPSCLQLGLHGRLFLSFVFFHLLFPGGGKSNVRRNQGERLVRVISYSEERDISQD